MSNQPGTRPKPSQLVRLRNTAVAAVIIFVLMVGTRVYVAETFAVPSKSMSPTLEPGDRMVAWKLTPDMLPLTRGDVVIFSDPANWLPSHEPVDLGPVADVLASIGVIGSNPGDLLAKRVIGLPGDHVVSHDGGILVNDIPLNEPYLAAVPAGYEQVHFDVTVPPNRMWVMGDNRSNSLDSRFHTDDFTGGFVPIDNVIGRVWIVTLPLDRFGVIPGL